VCAVCCALCVLSVCVLRVCLVCVLSACVLSACVCVCVLGANVLGANSDYPVASFDFSSSARLCFVGHSDPGGTLVTFDTVTSELVQQVRGRCLSFELIFLRFA
jgi:hypothetical protein